jgi:hypothetical protein
MINNVAGSAGGRQENDHAPSGLLDGGHTLRMLVRNDWRRKQHKSGKLACGCRFDSSSPCCLLHASCMNVRASASRDRAGVDPSDVDMPMVEATAQTAAQTGGQYGVSVRSPSTTDHNCSQPFMTGALL